MADLKISQLNAKGTPIAATDLIEISESDGAGGYVTKSVTGANIIGSKQNTLISGTNIKTINSNTLLGSGDLTVQPTLVSGTNIKTINSNSILGSGDLVISSGVSSVSATSPVVATGTTTPVISLVSSYGDTQNPYASKTANNILAAPNGSSGAPTFRAIVGADIPTLNQNTTGTASNVTGIVAVANGGTGTATPSLVGGTNITVTGTFPNQTITATGTAGAVTQIVAGTNVTISPAGGTGVVTINSSSGSGGLFGINNIFQGQSGDTITNRFIGASTNFTTYTNNIIRLQPFISNFTFTTTKISLQILTGVASATGRILIYSNLNTKPNTKLYESPTIDFSTSGIKAVTTSFTFNAGTVYWLGFQNFGGANIASLTSASLIPFLGKDFSNGIFTGYETTAYNFGDAPATMGAVTAIDASFLLLLLTIA